MKVVIANDSFKGTMSSSDVSKHIKKGVQRAIPNAETIELPIADGGEGTVKTMVKATNGTIIECSIHDLLMRKINGYYGVLGDKKTVIIEMAVPCSIALVKENEKNPMNTTTYGLGELIKDAIDKGYKDIIIGIGGGCTNDLGLGMAQALGYKFYDKNNVEILKGASGKHLNEITRIEKDSADERVSSINFSVASDVNNMLFGEEGAAYIYGPQKGATKEMVEILDCGLKHTSGIIKKDIGCDIENIPGSGAAGGLGGGLIAFLNAKILSGIDLVLDSINIDEILRNTDLVITGEGRTDRQTAFGKVVVGVASRAKKHGIPVAVLSGCLQEGYEAIYNMGVDGVFSNCDSPMEMNELIQKTGEKLEEKAFNIANFYKSIWEYAQKS